MLLFMDVFFWINVRFIFLSYCSQWNSAHWSKVWLNASLFNKFATFFQSLYWYFDQNSALFLYKTETWLPGANHEEGQNSGVKTRVFINIVIIKIG
jgi:hypothetical protein